VIISEDKSPFWTAGLTSISVTLLLLTCKFTDTVYIVLYYSFFWVRVSGGCW